MDIIIAFILGCIAGALLVIFCLSLAYAAKRKDERDNDD